MAVKRPFHVSLIAILLSAYVGTAQAQTPNPPAWQGAIVPTGEFDDLFARWEGNSAFWFGNRMNDPSEIQADSESTGFHWDGLPHHEIDADEGATILHFFRGATALPLGAQLRFAFPTLKPSNSTMATFVWEAKYDPRFFTGGKSFQIGDPSGGDTRSIEHNPVFDVEQGGEPTWLIVPATRTYSATAVGGNGDETLLSSEEWAQRNVQPARSAAPGRQYDYSYARDHVTGTNTGTYNGKTVSAFLIKPGQWYRYIYTIDWSSSPSRLWLWMEAEDTPRTLLLADENDSNKGFVLEFGGSETGANEFWFEFNNSSTSNAVDFDVSVRNLFVLQNVLGRDL